MFKINFPNKNLGVSAKFTMAYLIILLFQIVITGLYLYFQASNAAVNQGKLVMEQNLMQTKASIQEKEKIIENAATILTYNENVQDFFEYDYSNDVYQVEDYQFKFSPIVKIILTQNRTINSMKIYMPGTIVTEKLNSFSSVSAKRSADIYKSMLKARPNSIGWGNPHQEYDRITNTTEPIFSYNSKIMSRFSYKNIGFLEIAVKEKILFEMLRNPVISSIGRVFIINNQNMIVSDNIHPFFNKNISVLGLKNLNISSKINEIRKVKNINSVVISIPIEQMNCSVVGIFPVSNFNSKAKESVMNIIALMVLLSLILGTVIYFTTNALLSRIRKLVKAMKQVRVGHLDVSVEVKSNDEFGELASSFNLMTSRLHDLVETNYKIQIMEREAELKALESQINPHFLYNTLATISWTARKNNQGDVIKITNALAKFYRLVLSKGNTVISVKDELDIVVLYLSIQKIRFADTLEVIYDIDENIYKYRVVKNILQPLVENALVHGIEPKRGKSTLIIKAGENGDKLWFKIIDDGLGMSMETIDKLLRGKVDKTSGSGYAIKNIMKRLNAYYGEEHSFEVFSRKGFGTVITLTVNKNIEL